MTNNEKGSFTVEASIILPIILLIIVIFFKSIISQYIVYYSRGLLKLEDNIVTSVDNGIYFRTETSAKELNLFDDNTLSIEYERKELNYLKWAHHYLKAEELIGAFNDEFF